jgi:hypothetical protein
MRLCTLACLLVTAPASLAGCAAEADRPDDVDLESAQAEETTLLLVTTQRDADFPACVAAADALEGFDLLLELPKLFKFAVSTSVLAPLDAQIALRGLPCVADAEHDAIVDDPQTMCTDFAARYCAKAVECMTPAELAERGWADPAACIAEWEGLACMLASCDGFDPVAGHACNSELTTGTCALFRETLSSFPTSVYPSCGQVCR